MLWAGHRDRARRQRLHYTSTPTGGDDVRWRKPSAGSHRRTEVAPSDYIDEGEEGPLDEASGGEYLDKDDGENAGISTLTARGKTMPWGRKHIRHEPDEEDELMMYVNLKMLPSSYSLDTRVHRSLTRPADFTG